MDNRDNNSVITGSSADPDLSSCWEFWMLEGLMGGWIDWAGVDL